MAEKKAKNSIDSKGFIEDVKDITGLTVEEHLKMYGEEVFKISYYTQFHGYSNVYMNKNLDVVYYDGLVVDGGSRSLVYEKSKELITDMILLATRKYKRKDM